MVSLLEYFKFAKHHARFLAFGFVVAFASSAGQTYFIGIFGPSIRQAFSLSHTQWGTIYMIGTLCSAALLPWSGGLLDRFDLRRYAAAVLSGLIVACLFISATPTAFLLIVAVFLLRQFGQGLTSHTAITSMARYMTSGRGKAIAIASMGYSTGEALLPFIAVLCIAAFGWRTTWQFAAIMVVLLIPVVMWLLRRHDERHRLHMDDLNARIASGADVEASRTRRQMLGELRFYLLLPAVMAPSYISTGLFFHHLTLAEAKQWSGAWVTGNYWVYALCAISASLISGPLIEVKKAFDSLATARASSVLPVPGGP